MSSSAEPTWTIYGKSYSLLDFAAQHPGGSLALLLGAARGEDATVLFEQYHLRPAAARAALAARSGDGAAPRPPPAAGAAFHAELLAAVAALPGGHRCPRWMAAALAALAALTAASWAGWAAGSLPAAAALPFLHWLLFVNSAHDGGHFALSSSPALNEAASWTAAPLFYNSAHWLHQHVASHHVHTNEAGDYDLHHMAPHIRLHARDGWLPAHAHQAAFVALTTPLDTLVQSTVFPARLLLGWGFLGQPGGGAGAAAALAAAQPLLARTRGTLLLQLAASLAALAYPFLAWGATLRAAAWALYPWAVASLLFMAVTQVSHVQAAAQRHPVPAGGHWARRMVAASVDYAQGSRLAAFLTGGLNCQGLHHCVPILSSAHFPDFYPTYRAIAARHGVQIQEEPSFAHALAAYWRHVSSLAVDDGAAAAASAAGGKAHKE